LAEGAKEEAVGVRKVSRSRTVEDRLKDIQHEILIAVASGKPLPEVMALLCKRAEKIAPNAICSILRVDSSGRLRPLAAPSLPDAFPGHRRRGDRPDGGLVRQRRLLW